MKPDDIKVLSNADIPEVVRAKIAEQILSSRDRAAERELEKQKLASEDRKLLWNTPVVAAFAGLLTLSATFIFDRLTAKDDTSNTTALDTMRAELKESEERLKQELALGTNESLARLEAESKERDFQYEIMRSELEKDGKSNADRAAVLLFLVKAGVLTALKEKNLEDMAKEQQQNPDRNIIPQLSSTVVGIGRIDRSLLFENGSRLSYAFMQEPTEAMRSAVEEAVREWMKYANVEFVPAESAEDAMIRVMPSSNQSASMIGKQALSAPNGSPTMWLFERETYSVRDKAVVLHEFGHALGFVHEHQNPKNQIPWDIEGTYAYFSKPPNNWGRSSVDRNFLTKSEFYPCSREFDPESIMMFSIAAEMTTDGTAYGASALALSESDKVCASEMYPK